MLKLLDRSVANRIVRATLAVLSFGLAIPAVAAPPRQGPLAGSADEAALRRLVASATAPSTEAESAKLNGILTARLRALITVNLPPTPAARPVLAAMPHAACADPMISRVEGEPNGDGTVTPDHTMEIVGCGLGTAQGSATLVLGGSRPPLQLTVRPVCLATDFSHEISCWQDFAVAFGVPHVEGVRDSPATLVVTTASGKTLQVPVKFVALRQSIVLYGEPPIYGKCSHKTNNDDCVTTQSRPLQVNFDPGSKNYSILARHQSLCCFTGVHDHDDYQVSLPSQWAITDLQIAVDPQFPYCSNAFSNPHESSSATLESPVFSADKSAVNFKVDYSVGAVCSEIAYAISIVASVPLGTPIYVVNPPSGHR